MKLFVSALLLLAVSAACAQNQNPAPIWKWQSHLNPPIADGTLSPQPMEAIQTQVRNAMWAAMEASKPAGQVGCPLVLTSASVAPEAGYLPVVSPQPGHDGALDLHFRNSSGKAITSATISAHLRVKTNIYALDASRVDVTLTFSGTKELDREADQLTHIPLPDHAYLFGVAQVSLDQVWFADGTTWNAPGAGSCAVRGGASLPIEAQ